MEGHRVAFGLFLVLIASGCTGMTGNAEESPGLESADLSVEQVENVTGANYSAIRASGEEELSINVSSAVKRINSFFEREDNISEAPETVQSMIFALNGSSEEKRVIEERNTSSISIDGYEARKLDSENSTALYGERENLSFIVKGEGDNGIYGSVRELYVRMAENIEDFRES